MDYLDSESSCEEAEELSYNTYGFMMRPAKSKY